jgi:CubicO group peptidase (beta-lactamase class C family)
MFRSEKNVPWLIPALIIIISCSGGPKADDRAVFFEREISRLMQEAGVPGLSIAVIRGGKISWSGAFGVRDLNSGDPVDENTMFESASLTKPVTAFAALRLVEKGQLDVDRPLHEYFPGGEYRQLDGDERYKKITARLILSHATGLPNWGARLIREPGERFGYSGEGFHYLGRAIVAISGRSLQDFAKQEIFDPLGMGHTSYVWNEAYAVGGASGHDAHGKSAGLRKFSEPNGASSLLTTARDYGSFLCALLDDRGLPKEMIMRMISPQVRATKRGPFSSDPAPDEHVSWGWGWGIQPGISGTGFWHWGDNGGLRAYAAAYKDRKEGLVYFTNSENGLAIAEPVTALVLADHQYSLDWLSVERYDGPKRAARLSVEDAFLKGGPAAGLLKLDEARRIFPANWDENLLNQTAGFLDRAGMGEAAVAVYARCLESYPSSIDAHFGTGISQLGIGRAMAARASFDRLLKIRADHAGAKRGVQWAEDVLRADKDPVVLTAAEMRKFEGDYGPRRIRLRGGDLYYQREGGLEYKLRPLTRELFSLEGNAPFRIRFVADGAGRIVKLVGFTIAGESDESPRDG